MGCCTRSHAHGLWQRDPPQGLAEVAQIASWSRVLNNTAPYLLDITRLVWRRWRGRRPTGIDRVCLAYLNEFRGEAQAVIHHKRFRRIFDRSSSEALFALLAEPPAQFRSSFTRALVRAAIQRPCQARGRVYLNVGHTGLNDPGFRRWAVSANVKPVYLVHDLIPITHPEYCRAGEGLKHTDRMNTVVKTASGIIANSKATLSDLSIFARTRGQSLPPSVVAFIGSDGVRELPLPSQNAHPSFVILGTIEARKNHLLLLQVWTKIVERLGTETPRLLVIGQRGWECEQAADLLDRSEALKGSVIEVQDCSDEMLSSYLANACALLFPSLVEGYGLPLVEALRCGTPVIASDLPVFREIAGDIPDYLDPIDGPSWARAIIDYSSENSPRRDAQLKRLAGYHPPRWHDHFVAVRTWLSSL